MSSAVVLKWKNQRDVRMLSTKHSTEYVDTGEKDRKCIGLLILKTLMVIDYNKSKMGKDISDQMSVFNNAYTLVPQSNWGIYPGDAHNVKARPVANRTQRKYCL